MPVVCVPNVLEVAWKSSIYYELVIVSVIMVEASLQEIGPFRCLTSD